MTKKATQNKDFRTVLAQELGAVKRNAMQKPKPLSDLLTKPGNSLDALRRRLGERSRALAAVQSALPAKLAAQVLSAGVEQGRLTIGVGSAVWASRLRYSSAALRKHVAETLPATILTVRIRVLPPSD